MKLGVFGYGGRMGQLIAAEIASRNDCALGGGLVRDASNVPKIGYAVISARPEDVIDASDAIIDFTTSSSTATWANLVAAARKPFMCGTTGLGIKETRALEEAAEKVPVLHAANTSLSLAVVKHLSQSAARGVPHPEFDVAILDTHHRHKKHAPSGTALALGAAVIEGSGGRSQPAYASVRAGEIVGEHEVVFAGSGETIRLVHSVTDRRIFARGAVEAALWLQGRRPGLYTMDDVLQA